MRLKKPLLVLALALILGAAALILPAAANARDAAWFLVALRAGSSDFEDATYINDRWLDPENTDYAWGLEPSASYGDSVDLYYDWVSYGKGETQTITNYASDTVEIYRTPYLAGPSCDPDDLMLTITPEQAKAFLFEAEELGWPPEMTFNGKCREKAYITWWMCGDGILYPPLVAGDYTIHWTAEFRHPVFLKALLPWMPPDLHRPYKILAGTYDSWLWFRVTP